MHIYGLNFWNLYKTPFPWSSPYVYTHCLIIIWILSGFAPAEAADSQRSTGIAFAETLAARGLEVEHWGDLFGVPIIFSWITDLNIIYIFISHDSYI